jgi:hypothetical protein
MRPESAKGSRSTAAEAAAIATLVRLRRKGVRIWREDNRLRYEAPAGVISERELESLRAQKTSILALLARSRTVESESSIVRKENGKCAPLTYSQLCRWNLLRLAESPSTRSVFAATRLFGKLDVERLRASLTTISRRHEALRMRISSSNGQPVQLLDDQYVCNLEYIQLLGQHGKSREATAAHIVEEFVTGPVDVGKDPLFSSQLIRLAPEDHVLVVAMEHMISDASSTNILLREIWAQYSQLPDRRTSCLRPPRIQYSDYAHWQYDSRPSWGAQHGEFWEEWLQGGRRIRVFAQQSATRTALPRFACCSVDLGMPLSLSLRALCRRHQTTLSMSILSIYAMTLFQWCSVRDIVVPYLTLGRNRAETQDCIGFFASRLFLRIRLLEDDTFVTLLQRVTKEYLLALEHDDMGMISAAVPSRDFAWNPSFNWFPESFRIRPEAFSGSDTGITDVEQVNGDLRVQPFPVETAVLDQVSEDIEGGLLLSDRNNNVTGRFVYRSDCASETAAQGFVHHFRKIAQLLSIRAGDRLLEIETNGRF